MTGGNVGEKLTSRIVGIGDLIVSREPGDLIVTYSLGSCVGVTAWDSALQVGGMVHCMLPLSKADPERSRQSPGMYVDSGVSTLLEMLFGLGARRKTLAVHAAGGANVIDDEQRFRIGERNHAVLKKILWKNDLLLAGEDCGGNVPRTMKLYVESGRVTVVSGGQERGL